MDKLRLYIRKLLKESLSHSFTVEQIFSLIEYHDSFRDLYPGNDPEYENEYGDGYYFSSKEDAYENVQMLIDMFNALPNPILIYRAIKVEKIEDIDYGYLGDSWSYLKQSALNFSSNHNGGNVLLSAEISKEEVDWKETFRNHFLFSDAIDESSEDEIKVSDIDALLNVKAEWIKNLVKENIQKTVPVSRFIYHASNPVNRKRILTNGISVFRGDQWMGDTPIKGKAVFATNSDNQNDWFDSTFDDDIWRIDTSKLDGVKWLNDPNYEYSKHIYTHSNIPLEAIELIRQGTGKDYLYTKTFTLDDIQKHQQTNRPSSDIIFGAKDEDTFTKLQIPINSIKAPKGLSLSYYKKKGLDEDIYIVEKLMRLIDNGTMITPLVLDENNKIMDGLHRYVAYKEMEDYHNGSNSIIVYKRVNKK